MQTLIHPFFAWVHSFVRSAASLKGFKEKRDKKLQSNNAVLWEHISYVAW